MISIVIPLYNKELSITNTLRSVFAQTFQKFEVLIVNDGSTDRSMELMRKFDVGRITFFNQVITGVSRARNHGISEARFQWVAFLDGDDVWKENHLERIVSMMELFPGELIYATSFKFSDRDLQINSNRKSSVYKIDNYFASPHNLLWTSIVVVNKECFFKVGGFN